MHLKYARLLLGEMQNHALNVVARLYNDEWNVSAHKYVYMKFLFLRSMYERQCWQGYHHS
jgi:hypothetical protein